MSWGFQWRPYVPVAQRRAKAARQAAKLAKGRTLAPVEVGGRQIASTFWGKAWCDNLEAYSDFANRLPRGRTYVRNGSVIDLQLELGKVSALVSGSSLYRVNIRIKPLAPACWREIKQACAGRIDSVMELLQGRLSAAVMQVVTRQEDGLFPTPRQIEMGCSCPDWAGMCKHVAATLYGVGNRLDQNPELLFLLRGVDPGELISQASATEAIRQASPAQSTPGLSDAELADVFGIELAGTHVVSAAPQPPAQPPTRMRLETVSDAPAKPPAKRGAGPKRRATRGAARKKKRPTRLSAAARALMVKRFKARWAKLKAAGGGRRSRVTTRAKPMSSADGGSQTRGDIANDPDGLAPSKPRSA